MEPSLTTPGGVALRTISWTSVVLGALIAAAFSFIFITFGTAVGLGVSSASPSWRDASSALALLSGLYLIIQAIVSFGIGGYIAGRVRGSTEAAEPVAAESRDGLHGLAAWSVAIVIGATIAAIASGATGRSSPISTNSSTIAARSSAAEPLLSYELDRLFRSTRRAPNVDIGSERAEAGRILLTSSSHDGMSSDDRAYLSQMVGATTGLAPADADRRVDVAIANSKTAMSRSRRSAVILAFSIATALLIGAVVSWAAACAGGRHRDGAPEPHWFDAPDFSLGRTKTLP